jgi:hypothetical protein
MDVKVKFVGVKEIDSVLKGLPRQINHKLLQSAHVQASKILVDKAKLLAPEGKNGDLIDSIGTMKESVRKASELGMTKTGPRRRKGRYKGHTAHIVEYGRSGRRMKVTKFMEPAWVATRNQVTASINGFLGKALYNFMRRTIKNG